SESTPNRDLPRSPGSGIRPYPHFEWRGRVRDIRQPLPVWRELRIVFVGLRIDQRRRRAWFPRGRLAPCEREYPDIGAVSTARLRKRQCFSAWMPRSRGLRKWAGGETLDAARQLGAYPIQIGGRTHAASFPD